MPFEATIVGFAAGALIGATGVGAGALMTPLLVGVFRLSLPVAIATDLWFAALTKLSGGVAHYRQGHVDVRVVALLLSGSLPAVLLTVLAMRHAGMAGSYHGVLGVGLGLALLLTAAMVAARGWWTRQARLFERRLRGSRVRTPLTVASGALLGVLVTLTSVGAGAIGSTLILLLHPRLPARRLVGTDIAHALPLTLAAGVGHSLIGHVEWLLLAQLLLGSIPGTWLGARLTGLLPERVTRGALSAVLVLAGLRIIA